MDLHYKQEVTVGLLVIVAIVMVFGGLTFLTGRSFGGAGHTTFAARFENIAGLGVGDPIHVSGVRVGRVGDIDLQAVNDVVVYLEVSDAVRPHVDARAAVRAIDAFGAMFVDYVPGRSDEFLREGQVITGSRDVGLMETAADVATQASDVLAGAGAVLSPRTADDIHETLGATRRAMNVIAQLGSGPMVREATATLEKLSSVAAKLDSILGSPDLARSLAQLDEIAESLNEMVVGLGNATNALAAVIEKVDADSGTLGRLVNDTTMYNEMIRLTTSMRLLLDDMRERPGRYFSLKVF
ncbi:MAG TPA: MlaD family protein [Gemmatimonadales bacterium]